MGSVQSVCSLTGIGAIARHHLTIHEKNELCLYHRERPELTQEQLQEWIHEKFGKWIGCSTIGKIASTPEEVCANPASKRIQSGRFPEMEAELYEYIRKKHRFLWTKANEILARLRGSSTRSVSLGWVQRFKKRHRLHRSQSFVICASAPLEQRVEEHPVEPALLKSTGVVGAKQIREVDEQNKTTSKRMMKRKCHVQEVPVEEQAESNLSRQRTFNCPCK
ncbi:hypothetical protein PsorP6_008424 [Peronosclerospora sorghi]|uniref:Uncharacterized protein n=1 Tax=Peronosclerospora sorghi TaxID=230839 RepID=A0ACC0WAZ7_9STRA|nr:hypothetical protein PsorP6_008424 [Peronosclerospora sorghi]